MVSAVFSLSVFCALLACCCSYSLALFEDQVGLLDWHVKLIGTPRSASFYKGSKDHTILVETERNVLASLDLKSGDAVWRQVLSNGEKLHTKVHKGKQLVSVSTMMVSLWNADNGGLLWEYELPVPSPSIGAAAFTTEGNVVAVHQAGIVLLDGKNGNPKWATTFTPTDVAKFSKIHLPARSDQIYLFGLSDEKHINIASFDLARGKESKRYTLNAAPQNGSVIFAGSMLAWLENGNIVAHTFGNKDSIFKTAIKDVVGTSDHPHQLSQVESAVNAFIVRAGATAAIARLGENGKAERVHLFPKLVGSASFAGTRNAEGSFSISIVTETIQGKALVQIVDLAAVVVKTEYEVDFNAKKSGSLEKSFIGPNHEILLVTADGAVCLLTSHNSKSLWSREEGLADLVSAEYVDLPESKMWSQQNDELDELPEQTEHISSVSRYFRRLRTHIEHAKNALLDIQSVIRLIPSYLGGMSFSDSSSEDTSLFRDMFGYRKLIIVATRTGKILALDSKNNGRIVWMTYLGPSFQPSEIHCLRTAVVKFPPVVVVIGITDAADTVIWRINALTGGEFLGDSKQDNVPAKTVLPFSAIKIFKLPIEEQVERTHVLGLLKQPAVFTTYPQTHAAKQAFDPFSKKLFYALGQIGDTRLSGYSVDSKTMKGEEIWHIQFPEGERIVAVGQRPSHDKVASLGRVLGNRSVLYKYLNPNMQTYATYNDATSTLKIYTVDITKGAVLHSGVHRSAGKQAVHVIQCENWIVYHYWSGGEEGSNEKGYIAVVSEFFESDMPDVRYSGDKFTSFSSQKPFVITRSFSSPYGITAVGVSTTRLGISTREILFATQKGQIYGVPRRMLDARRPNPPSTTEQKEEMLVPYEAIISENPKAVLTYHLEVLGTQSIITSPALLESTSLVFAFGLDLFHTRVSPSKQFDVLSEDFSKSGLLATMAACMIGILVTRPLVRRKKTNASWQ